MSHKFFFSTLFIFLTFLYLGGCEKNHHSQTTGYVEANLFYLSNAHGGYLQKIYVHEGQLVKRKKALVKFSQDKDMLAPKKAKIMDIYFQEEEFVPPGLPILSMLTPNELNIIFFIPEKNLKTIKIGKKIKLLIDNKQYETQIISIGRQAEYTPDAIFSEQNQTKLVYKIKASISLELQQILKPGQPVDIIYD